MKLNKKIAYLACLTLIFCAVLYLKFKSSTQFMDGRTPGQGVSSVFKNNAPSVDYRVQKNSTKYNNISEPSQAREVSSDFLISSLRIVGGNSVYIKDINGHISGIRDGKILNEIKGVEFIQYNNPPDSGEQDSAPTAFINEYGFSIDGYIKNLVLYANSDEENKRSIDVDEFVVRGNNTLANRIISFTEGTRFIEKEIILDEYSLLIHVDDSEIKNTIFYKGDPMYKN